MMFLVFRKFDSIPFFSVFEVETKTKPKILFGLSFRLSAFRFLVFFFPFQFHKLANPYLICSQCGNFLLMWPCFFFFFDPMKMNSFKWKKSLQVD